MEYLTAKEVSRLMDAIETIGQRMVTAIETYSSD